MLGESARCRVKRLRSARPSTLAREVTSRPAVRGVPGRRDALSSGWSVLGEPQAGDVVLRDRGAGVAVQRWRAVTRVVRVGGVEEPARQESGGLRGGVPFAAGDVRRSGLSSCERRAGYEKREGCDD